MTEHLVGIDEIPELLRDPVRRIRKLEEELNGRISDLTGELMDTKMVLARIGAWTHEHGAALCPPRADTYGEGMRDAKQQVAKLLERT